MQRNTLNLSWRWNESIRQIFIFFSSFEELRCWNEINYLDPSFAHISRGAIDTLGSSHPIHPKHTLLSPIISIAANYSCKAEFGSREPTWDHRRKERRLCLFLLNTSDDPFQTRTNYIYSLIMLQAETHSFSSGRSARKTVQDNRPYRKVPWQVIRKIEPYQPSEVYTHEPSALLWKQTIRASLISSFRRLTEYFPNENDGVWQLIFNSIRSDMQIFATFRDLARLSYPVTFCPCKGFLIRFANIWT